ncbi:hypothetical protein H0H87_006177, partial [Tephrocybe sp. NHM501043]
MDGHSSDGAHYLVVIDALDELKDGGLEFLRELLLAISINNFSGLKFLVTSRSRYELVDLLNSFTRKVTVRLQEVPIDEAQEDIKTYLKASLLELSAYPALENLVEQSGGLFIYAATVVRYLTFRPFAVSEKLEMLTEFLYKSYDAKSAKKATEAVDQLYRWIMLDTFSELTGERLTRRLQILYTFLFAAEPVSLSIVAALLPGVDEDTASGVLHDLHSVLYIADGHVFWYHASFPDFVSDQARSNFKVDDITYEFSYDPLAHNKLLTAACLRIMASELKRNICLLDEAELNDEVSDLEGEVMEHISAPLQYASRFWALHFVSSFLNESYLDDDALGPLETFCTHHLLHWIEILSLLRELRIAGEALSSVHHVLNVSLVTSCQVYLLTISVLSQQLPYPPGQIQNLLSDCGQIIRDFSPALHMSWSQIYLSAIPFSPLGSHIRRTYSQIQSPMIIQGLPNTWGMTLSIMQSPGWRISSVLFSPNGRRIVSSSNESIILWDSQTGAQIGTLAGIDTSCRRQMAFSTDGRILYTSDGPQVLFLDAGNGDIMRTLEAQSEVRCLALSSNGELLAAGLTKGEVIVWNVCSGDKVVIVPSDYVDCYMDSVNPAISYLTFSKSGTFLAWGSFIGCTIWRVNDWSIYRNFHGPMYPESIDISVDDHIVVCGSRLTAMIWDMQADAESPLFTMTAEYSQVKFWPLNKDILAILSEGTFLLWNVVNMRPVASEEMVQSYIASPFAFSPDGRSFVTAESHDTSIRILKVPAVPYSSPPLVEPFPIPQTESGLSIQRAVSHIHQKELGCLPLSPDGSLLAIASGDHCISLWNSGMLNSGPKHILYGGGNWVAFSQSGKQIVSISYGSLEVWDAEDEIC